MVRQKFQLTDGLYLVITKCLQHEEPDIVAYSHRYDDAYNYWMDNPDREWAIAVVRQIGKQQFRVNRIVQPIPPKILRRKLARRQLKTA